MSTGPRPLEPVAATEDPGPELEAQALTDSGWPRSPSASAALTLLLLAALAAPAAMIAPARVWPLLALPTPLAGAAARLALDAAARGGRGGRVAGALAVTAGAGAGSAILVLCGAVLGSGQLGTLAGLTLAATLGALAAARLVRALEVRSRLASRRVYFAGSPQGLRELRRELYRNSEATVVGACRAWVSASPEAIAQAVRASGATVLLLDREATQCPQVVAAATAVQRDGVRVRDLLGYCESELGKVVLSELTPAWFLFQRTANDRPLAVVVGGVRRAAAVLSAAALLLLCAPLLAVLVVAIRLSSPGPAIFKQPRVGKDGKRFTLLKLRTMTVAEDDGAWASDQAHRITPLGRVLRRYRLDELPQLYNVLRGELALIGPRPEQVPIVQRLEHEIPFYALRHSVRPGLTGWAQVNLGYSGSLEGSRAKLARDLYYVKHRSLRLDLRILWMTLQAIFVEPR